MLKDDLIKEFGQGSIPRNASTDCCFGIRIIDNLLQGDADL